MFSLARLGRRLRGRRARDRGRVRDVGAPRLVAQQALVKIAELAARLDPDLLDQRPPRIAEDRERVGLAPGARERLHQQHPDALLQRMQPRERFQLRDRRRHIAERQPAGGALDLGGQPAFLEPCRLGAKTRAARDICQRLAAP